MNLFLDDTLQGTPQRVRSMSFSGGVPSSPSNLPWEPFYANLQITKEETIQAFEKQDMSDQIELIHLTYKETLELDHIKIKRESQPSLVIIPDTMSINSGPNSPIEQVTYNDFQKVIQTSEAVDLPKAEVKEQDIENVLDDLLRPSFKRMEAK